MMSSLLVGLGGHTNTHKLYIGDRVAYRFGGAGDQGPLSPCG